MTKLPSSHQFGQRSILSMFSNPHLTTGKGVAGSQDDTGIPLMEFLNRKLNKRSFRNQGRRIHAGITPTVENKLEYNGRGHSEKWVLCRTELHREKQELQQSTENHDTPDTQPNQAFLDTVVAEHLKPRFFTPSVRSDALKSQQCAGKRQFRELPDIGDDAAKVQRCESLHCRRPTDTEQVIDSLSRDKKEDRRICAELDKQKRPSSSGRPQWQGAQRGAESYSSDFIDLTTGKDEALGIEVFEHDRALRSTDPGNLAGENFQQCPVCNDLVPENSLQEHVESELDGLSLVDSNTADELAARPRWAPCGSIEKNHDGRGWDWQHRQLPQRNTKAEVPLQSHGVKNRSRCASQSLLVLGDDLKPRTRPKKTPRPSAVFNHYADGGGWWDEGTVGVDSEAVGCAGVWEGLGSMSFGPSI